MSDNRTAAYAKALADIAEAEGVLSRVDAEFGAVAAALESNDSLRSALGDQAIPVERRQGIVEQLLGGKGAHPLSPSAAHTHAGREDVFSRRCASRLIAY